MRFIKKQQYQHSIFADWQNNPVKHNYPVRELLCQEQLNLCAYTMQKIAPDNNSSHIEHVDSQYNAPHRKFDYDNVVACANDTAFGAKFKAKANLFDYVHPLLPACETRIRYLPDGRCEAANPLDNQANQTITILGLNHKELVKKRRDWINGHGLYKAKLEKKFNKHAEIPDYPGRSELQDIIDGSHEAKFADGKIMPFPIAFRQIAENRLKEMPENET
ncbi:MAG: TIGR02646 family protein [Candidatus Symbiobacter sp.]|nr:TIGR02646 family protein [Candidatus Symbiobacter sp.]